MYIFISHKIFYEKTKMAGKRPRTKRTQCVDVDDRRGSINGCGYGIRLESLIKKLL